MNVLKALKALNAYPTTAPTVESIAEAAGLDTDADTRQARQTGEFKRATAYYYLYLAKAPNVSQGGISYSFSEDERKEFKAQAKSILEAIGDDTQELGIGDQYGYMGENF